MSEGQKNSHDREDEDTPGIEFTSVAELMVGPGRRDYDIGDLSVPFDTELTLFPILGYRHRYRELPLMERSAKTLRDARQLDAVLADQDCVDSCTTLFAPVWWKEPKRGALCRESSDRLAHSAIGTMESAVRSLEPATRQEGCTRAVESALEAIRFDPNNLDAYLAAAHACSFTERLDLSLDLFLTLVFRLRVAEKLLENYGNGRLLDHYVYEFAESLPGRTGWRFGPAFRQTIATLGVAEAGLNLAFPQVEKAIRRFDPAAGPCFASS